MKLELHLRRYEDRIKFEECLLICISEYFYFPVSSKPMKPKLLISALNLHSARSIIRMMKSRRIRWARHVARMGRRGMHIGYWWESQKERDH
jgi:hypothetical protein